MIDDHKQIIEQRLCQSNCPVCFKVSKGVQLTNDIVANGSILSIFSQLCGRLTRVRCSLIRIVIRCLFVCLGCRCISCFVRLVIIVVESAVVVGDAEVGVVERGAATLGSRRGGGCRSISPPSC